MYVNALCASAWAKLFESRLCSLLVALSPIVLLHWESIKARMSRDKACAVSSDRAALQQAKGSRPRDARLHRDSLASPGPKATKRRQKVLQGSLCSEYQLMRCCCVHELKSGCPARRYYSML